MPGKITVSKGGRRSKYNAKRTIVDGISFHSKAEAKRWSELKLLQKAGAISGLKRQAPFCLDVSCIHICNYVADFTYFEDGQYVVEDVKGFATPEYEIKKKLMRAVYKIEIREIRK